MKELRYYYRDAGGKTQGPLWLSQMRELLSYGRISRRTEVCTTADATWYALAEFPEIALLSRTEAEQVIQKEVAQAAQKRREQRLLIYAGIAILAYLYFLLR
jgi:hypothetical protein